MIPAVFVPLDRLPTTPAQKIDRAALPAPPATRPDLGHTYTAPATETERRIAAAWARALCLDRVGTDDNFFDLGGNSLRLLGVQAALAAGGTRVNLIDMFRYPTVRALAGFLDGGAQLGAGEVTAAAAAAQRGDDRRGRLNALAPRWRASSEGD
jgi:aryl carrier-like protein